MPIRRRASPSLASAAAANESPAELRDVIATVADDLYRTFHDPTTHDRDGAYDPDRYPPW